MSAMEKFAIGFLSVLFAFLVYLSAIMGFKLDPLIVAVVEFGVILVGVLAFVIWKYPRVRKALKDAMLLKGAPLILSAVLSGASTAINVIITAAIAGVILFVVVKVYVVGGILLGVLATVAAIAVVLWQAATKISANPPYWGLLTVFGVRTNILLKEGWVYLLFKPFCLNVIPITAERIPLKFNVEVWTPDNVRMTFPIDMTLFLDTRNPNDFITNGEAEGVEEIIRGIVLERVRQWASSKDEGPQTWVEARSANEEALYVVLKTVLGEETFPTLDTFGHTHIPSTNLMQIKFWNKEPKREEGKKPWSEIWKEEYTPAERAEIEAMLVSRREIVKRVYEGRGHYAVPELGVLIARLNIETPKVEAKVAEAAHKAEVERLELEADTIEARNLAVNTKELADTTGIPRREAMNRLQIERGKSARTEKEEIVGLSPETRDLIAGMTDPTAKVLAAVLSALGIRLLGGKKGGD